MTATSRRLAPVLLLSVLLISLAASAAASVPRAVMAELFTATW